MLTVIAGDVNGLQLTSMTVHIYSGSTDVYDVTNMAYLQGSPDYQTWVATAPIPQADLSPGTYTMTVDASDADETDTGITGPGPLDFVYTTTLTATAAPASVSYGKTSVTISGRLTGLTPGSGNSTPVDLGGIPVDLYDQFSLVTQIGTTQADGSYSGQVQLTSADNQYSVQTPSSLTIAAAYTPLGEGQITDATRVSASVSPEDFIYGGKADATLSGTAQYKSGTTWLPLQDYYVYVVVGGVTNEAITNGQGQFTYTFSPSAGRDWSAAVGGRNDLLQLSQAQGSIHVAVPLISKWFAASLTPFARLNVSGCVAVTAPGFAAPHGHMNIQYATGPRGPWKYLGRVSLMQTGRSSCDAGAEAYFKSSVPVRLAGAYYRANFPATPDYQAKASRAVFRWRYVTRITSLKVSPGRVHSGGKLSVSGRLQQYKARWLAYGKRRVLIVFRPKGTKTWYYIRKVTTSASGHFSARFVDPVSATWSAEYEGDKTHFATGGVTRYVPVSNARALSAAISWQLLSPQDLNPDRLRAVASFIGFP